jgi:hypothetical protein
MANRKYVIVDTSEINTIDFSQVLETNKYNLRYNNDETQFILKYEGNQPSSLTGKTEYSFNEIKLILDDINGDWYQELEF